MQHANGGGPSPPPQRRVLDLSKSDPEGAGLSPEACQLVRMMNVELVPVSEAERQKFLEAVVDFLTAVHARQKQKNHPPDTQSS